MFYDPNHVCIIHWILLDMVDICTKFELPIFAHSGGSKITLTLTMLLHKMNMPMAMLGLMGVCVKSLKYLVAITLAVTVSNRQTHRERQTMLSS